MDCLTCQIFVCPKDYFNQHVESGIALSKMLRAKGHITGDVVK